MKKIMIPGLIAALALSSVAKAELQVSGNVTTLAGYQHDSTDAAGYGAGGLTQGGEFGFTDASKADHFGFFVDQAELDLENEFGENIRARADIDFRDITGAASAVNMEQGYVTANLNVGNGMEFLIGKYNAPLSLEVTDRDANVFVTYTPGHAYLMPTSLIGTKFNYEFNDTWSTDVGVVNNLNGPIAGNSAIPSGFVRVGAKWGDEGRESFVNAAAAVGPEANSTIVGTANKLNKHLDLFGNLWGNWALGDFWDLGWEATYRQSDSVTVGQNQKATAGQLYAMYKASDVWSVQARGAAFWEVNPTASTGTGASTTGSTWSGFEGMTFSGTLGTTYQITDGAAMKLEYRFDLAKTDGGLKNANYNTGMAEFAYSF